ncbi:hypothetical protein NDU88_012132 [Pleurodeles waltl]|uniref:Uncharacterized protein n=1 Tax=Pleurodeles waltl TaxID=8319 RepID=A0AAV7R3S5_PLEWA|nr:hypothetical protein NDU88_012132 [Pleurodeles waltl]
MAAHSWSPALFLHAWREHTAWVIRKGHIDYPDKYFMQLVRTSRAPLLSECLMPVTSGECSAEQPRVKAGEGVSRLGDCETLAFSAFLP